jgi:hypothetical protein
LPAISIDNTKNEPVILTVNGSVRMRYGSINAMYVTVGYAGSITPRLTITKKISDPSHPQYYSDAAASDASFADLYLGDLNRMVAYLGKSEFNQSTIAGRRFSAIVSNANATVSDYLNALRSISAEVRAKYSLLKLQ